MTTRETLLSTPKGKIVVATTVMLTFISFWRAAAIVLNDMASTVYYIGGIAEQAIGRSAPWFVLAVMLFSYVMRLVYLESTMLFMRGGLYTVVKSTLGGTLAKLSVSALIFDFILTGPISAVSAAHYVISLFNKILGNFNIVQIPPGLGSVLLACTIILYFWWQNIKGIEESSSKAMRIMQITGIMIVLLLAWSVYTLTQIEWQWPSVETHLQTHAVGWLENLSIPIDITAVVIAVGIGHSFLGMSGLETFAQVSREIAHPKLKNLKRAGLIIFLFCFISTTSVSFFASMIIPDNIRPEYFENLISGLVHHMMGSETLKILFDAFVVFCGFLILSGAANTSLIGSNAVLNSVSEDGVLSDWFRKPHPHFGTSYRILNSITLLQIVTVLLSRGNVYLLGEAYAFGVMWSFVFQALSVTVLRYKNKNKREWKFPFNLHFGKTEIPFGLLVTLFSLLTIATTNLFTKKEATVSGIVFTAFLFIIFCLSEAKRKKSTAVVGLDPFRVEANPTISKVTVGARPNSILVPVIESKDLAHLNAVLGETDTKRKDVIVMTTHLLQGLKKMGSGEEEIFTDQEQELFTNAVKLAEKHGKTISLVVAASNDTFYSIAQIAFKLDCEAIVLRVSAKKTPIQQAKAVSEAWDRLPNASKKDVLVRVWRDGQYILDWHALPPLPDIPRETLRAINFLYRELNPEEVEKISRSQVIELAVDKLLKEYQAGQFTWSKEIEGKFTEKPQTENR